MTEQRKQLMQATSFGNPRRDLGRRFFQVMSNFLGTINSGLAIALVLSALIVLSLLVYAGIGVQHSERYVSDGTVFSCPVPSMQPQANHRR